MALLKLNNVTAMSESGGAITLPSEVTGTFIKMKMGQFQWDQGKSNGANAITGVGFQGNFIEGWVNYPGVTKEVGVINSYGCAKKVCSTIPQQCTQIMNDASNSVYADIIGSTSDATSGEDGNYNVIALSSFDTDGFTLQNTLLASGTPAGTHAFTYIVYYYGNLS